MLRPELVQYQWGMASKQRTTCWGAYQIPQKAAYRSRHGNCWESSWSWVGVGFWSLWWGHWEAITRKQMISERWPLWDPLLGSLLYYPQSLPASWHRGLFYGSHCWEATWGGDLHRVSCVSAQHNRSQEKPSMLEPGREALYLSGVPQHLLLTKLNIIPAGKRKVFRHHKNSSGGWIRSWEAINC